MTEKKIYEMAYHWASDLWWKIDSDIQKNPKSKLLKEKEQRAWETIIELEQFAKEKGYTL